MQFPTTFNFNTFTIYDIKKARINGRLWQKTGFLVQRTNDGEFRWYGPINLFILNSGTTLLFYTLLYLIQFKRSQSWAYQMGHTEYIELQKVVSMRWDSNAVAWRMRMFTLGCSLCDCEVGGFATWSECYI